MSQDKPEDEEFKRSLSDKLLNEKGHVFEIQTRDVISFNNPFLPYSYFWSGDREKDMGFYYGEQMNRRAYDSRYSRHIVFTDEPDSHKDMRFYDIRATDYAKLKKVVEPYLEKFAPIKITAYLDTHNQVQFIASL